MCELERTTHILTTSTGKSLDGVDRIAYNTYRLFGTLPSSAHATWSKGFGVIKLLLTLGCAGALVLPAAASSNLVFNGGFESGDFTGWILSGNPIPGVVDTSSPHSGTYAAKLFAAGSPGYMEQILPTNPGTIYQLTYFVESDGGVPNLFSAQIAGTSLFDATNIPSQSYVEYLFSFRAASNSTDLKFGFRDDPGSLHLDDIAVTATPEPGSLYLLGLAIASAVFSGLAKRLKRTPI